MTWRTLEDLDERKKAGTLNFDRVVIETTGLANPGPVAHTFFMDNTIADEFLLDAIITLVDAKHADHQLDEHEVVQRQVRFADRLFITKSDLVGAAALDALKHRLVHMNPRAAIKVVNFCDADIKELFDLRGSNLNSKLEIDPDFLAEDYHAGHDHVHDDDKIKSFVFRSDRAFDPNRLENWISSAASCRSTANACCATRACFI